MFLEEEMQTKSLENWLLVGKKNSLDAVASLQYTAVARKLQ
jgi:hypothetical protein